MDFGLGSNGAPYEYTVKEKKSARLVGKKVAFLSLYVVWAVGWLLLAVMTRFTVYLLTFLPLSLWILVFFTWRRTQLEYEFSFFAGNMIVSVIYGGRIRKRLVTVPIRLMTKVYPNDEKYQTQFQTFSPKKTYYLTADTENNLVLDWTREDGSKFRMFLEKDEKAMKIIKYYNFPALAPEIR